MSDTEYIFNFRRVDNFLDNINREGYFDTEDMDGLNKNFRFMVSTDCPDNIDDCLDEFGTLNNKVTLLDIGDNGLVAINYNHGINGNRYISIAQGSFQIDVGDGFTDLKALFLCSADTGYVIAYSIVPKTVRVKNEVVFPVNGVIWDVRTEV